MRTIYPLSKNYNKTALEPKQAQNATQDVLPKLGVLFASAGGFTINGSNLVIDFAQMPDPAEAVKLLETNAKRAIEEMQKALALLATLKNK